MAPQKRKRPHDEPPATEPPTRRTTRHSETVATEPEKQLRSRRVRANTLENPPAAISGSKPAPTTANDASKSKPGKATTTLPRSAPPAPATRRTRGQTADKEEPETEAPQALADVTNRVEPRVQETRPKQTAVPPPKIPTSPVASRAEPKVQANTSRPRTYIPPPKPPPQSRPQAPASSLVDPAAASVVTPKRRSSSAVALKPPPTPRSDRNIDQVMLGNICFKTWYPSYYSKEILGDGPGSGGAKEHGGAKIGGGKKDKEVMLDRLYVCPCCFKYSKELLSWSEHVRYCEKHALVPGTKVYTHPKGSALANVAGSTSASARAGGRGGHETTTEGEWSVWEIDGEVDVLFCQNLSLFAKLFLDNKSVFFDVTGFNYFLLVYTPPVGSDIPDIPQRPQICGFFSKEKMSWDNNNLACILVFPPWQRKGLGALLMGVSYEISRREGVLGGPEKPISELGRKGYKRFWAGEIARWILSLEPSDSHETRGSAKRETLVDIEDCSKATWIVQEDCLAVLREMGVVEEAGTGPPKPVEAPHEEAEEKEVKDMPRVRLDKEAVRKWVQANKIDLERTCDPAGFTEGYAIKEVEAEEEE
ncbi:hypothetical protein JX265_001691 [Neoarthrinium moseri]|uniref:histone acetyltransferase n=1 Tax=Neoarthrinium moseri TaxID=1658444 RepID=A0A9P9WVH0_9PEZI|nr:hypothetical protein JX265_001691 [Neoarthrinium moseri]